MDTVYNPKDIEQQAHEYWQRAQSFKVTEDLSKEKYYCLTMFPYPSGTLHMGHVRCYTLGDVIARSQRMQGKNVLQPIGWDAFGMPAENAAIQHKIHPAVWTYKNIDVMREQFKSLGFAYDWSRELTTCNPDYYRWEQWFFIKLYEKGLAYKKKAVVNWDPIDQTVLANEQVVDGRGWRSGALVERREISQWFIKITAYADELLDDLDQLEGWPEQVRLMQRNWIGRSEGIEIHFDVQDEQHDRLKIFTTRPDTLLGVTSIAIAAEHPLAKMVAEKNKQVHTFLDECKNIKVAEADMATLEKRGIDTGIKAIHPISGKQIPIWIANFVLMEYGAGAVMSVPAHDQRDWEFAQKYHMPVEQVIAPGDGSQFDLAQAAFTDKGILINSGQFTGLTSEQAFSVIAQYLTDQKKGKKKVHYRLRDWGVSRQRYWGTPIPMILCEECGPVPVPNDQLPIVLPENVEFTGSGSPLANLDEFVQTTCPKCGEEARRETDTFDTFVESSWYYARFACVHQDKAMLDDRAKYWTPVDFYVGGIEHAVMHLLYARFFHKLLRDEGLVNSDEPFLNLLTQGMVLKDGSKMSKSKGNTVDPQALINRYGADTVRLFTIFAAPPEASLEWSDSGVDGAQRFLRRLWTFAQQYPAMESINTLLNNGSRLHIDWHEASDQQRDIRRQVYELTQQANFDYHRCQFNTVASACMKLLNLLSTIASDTDNKYDQFIVHEGFSILLRLLAPITPHITHHLWRSLAYGKLILDAAWPKVIKDALKLDNIEYVVQINGKLRGHIKVTADADEQRIITIATNDPVVRRFVADKNIKKSIVVGKHKLVNLVVG